MPDWILAPILGALVGFIWFAYRRSVSDQRGFFVIFFSFLIAAVEVLSYLMAIFFFFFIINLMPYRGSSSSLSSSRSHDLYMSFIGGGVTLAVAVGCHLLRWLINHRRSASGNSP
jgi:RsiW-degrading membrane proteinase PrsW (M82 family)